MFPFASAHAVALARAQRKKSEQQQPNAITYALGRRRFLNSLEVLVASGMRKAAESRIHRRIAACRSGHAA